MITPAVVLLSCASLVVSQKAFLAAWQKGTPVYSDSYDLALVGAGIGTSYVTYRLFEANLSDLSTVVFEANHDIGGRLLTDTRSHPYEDGPPLEYGGMRMDPLRHTKVAEMVQQVAGRVYQQECDLASCVNGFSCCSGMLAPMMVSSVAYKNTGTSQDVPGLPRLSDERLMPLDTALVRRYLVCLEETCQDDWASRRHANASGHAALPCLWKPDPWTQALSLVPLLRQWYQRVPGDGSAPPESFAAAVEMACAGAASMWNASAPVLVTALHEVCVSFKDPASMVLSAIGYDDDPNKDSLGLVEGFVDEVVNLSGKTNFYMLRHGYQQLVKDILYIGGTGALAPLFGKRLTSIKVCGDVEVTRTLAKRQAAGFNQTTRAVTLPQLQSPPCKDSHIELSFADGSVSSASAVYLTPLPVDLVQVGGLEDWKSNIYNTTFPSMGAKLGFGWTKFSLAEKLGMSPCWTGPCQRLILDGDADWTTRQVWLWSDKTVLVYGNAVGLPEGADQPTQIMAGIFNKSGVGGVVQSVMDELRRATNLSIPAPDWANFKAWPDGSLLPDWIDIPGQETNFSKLLSRPLGPAVNVFYGNSEMSPTADFHTWAEGAFESADTVMDDLLAVLAGQKKQRQKFEPR